MAAVLYNVLLGLAAGAIMSLALFGPMVLGWV